jgi:hypothetical protein
MQVFELERIRIIKKIQGSAIANDCITLKNSCRLTNNQVGFQDFCYRFVGF